MPIPTNDQERDAMQRGFTQMIGIDTAEHCFDALVRPGTDYDAPFRLYDMDSREWLIAREPWNMEFTDFSNIEA